VVYATVLSTLLLCSGIGSAVSQRFVHPTASWKSAAAAGVAAGITAFLLTPVTTATIALAAPFRIGIAALMLALPGFFMGMPFPLLMSALKHTHPERIPWAFGINGFASVAGTVAAVLIAMTLGQTAVLAVGVGCYFAAAGVSFRRFFQRVS
jgi:hypothetical protein